MDRAPHLPAADRVRPGADGVVAWLFGALLLLSAFELFAQSTRIGYVDMKRLLDNAPQVLDAQARLGREFAARDERLGIDEQRLAELQARQRRSTEPAGSPSAVQLDAEINALRRSVDRTRQRLREELQQRTSEEVDRAFPRINEAVADYAREQDYDIVLSSPVIYASGRLDITDAVLDRLRRDFARDGQ